MESYVLTILLSILIPSLGFLTLFLVVLILKKKCLFLERWIAANDGLSERQNECPDEITAAAVSANVNEESIFVMDNYSPREQTCVSISWTQFTPLPTYSTLPRNLTRPLSSNPAPDYSSPPSSARYGYRLSPSNCSHFGQDPSVNRNEIIQALPSYWDCYILDAHYDAPPPYDSIENIHVDQPQDTHEILPVGLSTAHGSETWI